VVVFGNLFNISSKSFSVIVSIFAVASSSIRSSGFLKKALTNAINCFCHKLIDSEFKAIFVSTPFSNFDNSLYKSAFFKTSINSSFVKFLYFSFQYSKLSFKVQENKNGSCKINHIFSVLSE
jgi:hypothetical protein